MNPNVPANSANVVIESLPLGEIRPDPGQPRHFLPTGLAAALEEGLPPLLVLDRLVEQAAQDETTRKVVGSIASLAADIAANGLINPITVYYEEGHPVPFVIETGERRWWAHWWLVREGHESFRHIRALVTRAGNRRRRQLSENLRREGLTAVETALGLATLVLEIEGEDTSLLHQGNEGVFVPPALRELAHRRVKRNTWPAVLEEVGYTRTQGMRYLRILRLCDEALELAHRHNLPEGALRGVTRLDDPVAQVAAVRSLVAGKDPPKPPSPRSPKNWWRVAARLRKQLHWQTEEELESLRAALDDKRRQELQDLRDTLNRLLT